MRLPNRFSIAIAIAISLPAYCCAAVNYTVTDLGTLGGSRSVAQGINASGKVTGFAKTAAGNDHAFLYDGTMHDLGSLPSISDSYGFGINASGKVVGESSHGFLYDGTMHDLGYQTVAYAINDQGQMTGYADFTGNGTGLIHAFMYDGTMHDLGMLPGGNMSIGYGINASGQVAGYSVIPGGFHHAFFYNGTMHDLGTFGGLNSYARGINASGHVTGEAQVPGLVSHAFLYDGTMHDLGTIPGYSTHGLAINASGQIVGNFSIGTSTNADHAMLYDIVQGMVDLNSQISPSSGWFLTNATAINDKGRIVGVGTHNGLEHAFLLTPVPEPSSVVFAAFGLASLAAVGWRRKR